jgi:Zn-dependent metalloprotease
MPVPNKKPALICLLIAIFILPSCRRTKNISDISEPSLTPGWITFKKESNIDPKTLFKQYGNMFQIAPGSDLKIVSEQKDELGMVHYRYKQFFKNIPIEDAEFIVHAKNNRALTANGNLAMNFTPPKIQPTISEQDALNILVKRIPSQRYLNENDLHKDFQKAIQESGQSDYRPKGTLIFAKKQNTKSDQWELSWMFKAYVLPLDRSRQVYIKASDGSVLKELPLFGHCAAGSGDTTFRGNQNFNTKNTNGRFYLINDCNGNQLNAVLLDTANKAVDVNDDDNNWNGNNRSMVTSYWALDIVYDYFRLVHKRNSYDHKNSNMTINNNPNLMDDAGVLTPNNASGGGGFINIGFGTTNADNDDYNTVDIVGHEFGHSLIESTANLGYDATKESAALNESISDIFGQIVERWEEQNTNPDWVIGDAKGCVAPAICRDFKNPKAFKNPDTYKGSNWQSGTKIDPHANGNVQDRWFYLITDGETGTNSETSIQYSITGIGIEKARRIAYRTLTSYLNSSSDYKAAREATIHAAEDLFGVNSQEVGQVIKAWCAVGLCPYTQPKQPDRFDTKGGNPNPASPDNNNTLNGATPLGTGTILDIGKTRWSNDRYPKMNVINLSIYPFDDVDYFKITPPNVQNPFGGRCVHSGYAFNFTNNVNVKIYSGNSVVDYYTNYSYLTIEGAYNSPDFGIEVMPAFPGQILDYDMQVSYFFNFDTDCYRAGPRDKLQLIKDCIMCNAVALSPEETVTLDPGYRTKYKVPVENYYFYYDGQSAMEIPIQILNGNNLQAQLVDESGHVLATADNTADRNVVHLSGQQFREGVYSLRFAGFGNGTQIKVALPGHQ